jgi:hypothetical protein
LQRLKLLLQRLKLLLPPLKLLRKQTTRKLRDRRFHIAGYSEYPGDFVESPFFM